MRGDLDRIRACQAAIRREAMRYSTEEALNAMAAIVAEAIATVPFDDRTKLFQVFGTMVQEGLKAVHQAERRKTLPGLGAPLH